MQLSQLSQLPAALTAHILQFVLQRQRLSCCALVCSAWREAAAQATVHIDCNLSPGAAAAALLAWLEQHGRRVESLALRNVGDRWSPIPLQLPWARLSQVQSLSLTGIELPAINGSNGSAAAAGAGGGSNSGSGGQTSNTPLLSKLKQLHLQECDMHSPDSLVQLASSTGITSLVVENCDLSVSDGQQEVSTALCTLLQRLPQLVVLRLPDMTLSRSAIKPVEVMSSLQHLELTLDAVDTCGDCLADLPSSLTRLQLFDWRWGTVQFGQPTLPPQLQQLTSLQQLQLRSCSLSPAVLASIPQLQHLHLQRCILLPCEANSRHNPAATAALFGALQQLTRLQHLQICGVQLDKERPQQWAALTASSQLTHLSLVGDGQQPLPQGAAQHIFPAGRQLRQLQQLQVVGAAFSNWVQVGWCLDGHDLGSIVSCCPQLQSVTIDRTLCAGVDVSALLQLPASCSSLSIGGVSFADAAAPVVAQLTQLRELRWEQSDSLTDLGIQQLTALQGLSRLHVAYRFSISASMWAAAGVPGGRRFFDLVSTDTKGPVAQQLQEIVAAFRRELQEEA